MGKYTLQAGAKIAFARLWAKAAPAVREVRRPARVGEYIKIVYPLPAGNLAYKAGDIMAVVDLFEDADSGCYARHLLKTEDRVGAPILSLEYVVLENYVPKKEAAHV